ncbi:hypothetical protein Tco_0010807 [Tanacetum coccineum]
MTSVHNSSGLAPPRQMTSDHNCSELEIHDHSNELSSSKLVPKVVPPADMTATSRQELELLFHHHITMLRSYAFELETCQGDSYESTYHRHKIARWQRRSRRKDKDLKISDEKTKSKDNDKSSRSKITKHEGTSLQRIQRPRPQDLNDKSNLIDLMKECHNELTSGEIVSLKILSRTMEVRS